MDESEVGVATSMRALAFSSVFYYFLSQPWRFTAAASGDGVGTDIVSPANIKRVHHATRSASSIKM